MVDAFWCRYPSQRNFGDALTPWTIRRVSGRYPRFRKPAPGKAVLLGVGSIIGVAQPGSIVWGSGILDTRDTVRAGVEILAVRGPLTRARVRAAGIPCPDDDADPALLLPRLYRPARPVAPYGVGVVPHYLDKVSVFTRMPRDPALKPVDIQSSIEQVIDAIVACEAVVSSSLHGIITAHAYGVPALWLKFSDAPHGDGVKFLDYFRSIGCAVDAPLALEPRELDAGALRRLAREGAQAPGLDALWERCPFRPQASGHPA